MVAIGWGWGLMGLMGLAIAANLIFVLRLRRSMTSAPQLLPLGNWPDTLPSITVIIPAYNESVNLLACGKAVLASHLPDPSRLQVIIADDESEDDTAAIAQTLAAQDDRVVAFTVPPRPTDIPWQGKNWACANAVERATGDYWLFIDADVRLEPAAIARALIDSTQAQADLLSCAPTVQCGCLAEWLAQPIIIALIAVGFDFAAVNDPAQPDQAFAAGPFMLFRREAYQQIQGHRGVATVALEDVTLARRIKAAGLRLRYVLSGPVIQVRMYQNLAGLWEGWTKNFHLGGGRRLGTTLFAAGVVTIIFLLPWLVAVAGILGWILEPLELPLTLLSPGALGLAIAGVFTLTLHLWIRLDMAQQFQVPPRYLSLGALGGVLVTAIALVSIIKVETGWGWTWRGRPMSNAITQPD